MIIDAHCHVWPDHIAPQVLANRPAGLDAAHDGTMDGLRRTLDSAGIDLAMCLGVATVAKNVGKPLCVNMGFGIRKRSTTPLLSPRRMQELGVAVAIYPRLLTAAAVQGMKNGLAVLQQSIATGEVIERPDLAVSFEELNALVGFDEVQSIERRFLTQKQMVQKYGAAAE